MERRLTIKIDGPGVIEGKVALDDLRSIAGPLQSAMREMLASLWQQPSRSGRQSRRARPTLNLLILAVKDGSATAEAEVEMPSADQLRGFEHDIVSELIAAVADPTVELPRHARRALDRIPRNLPTGVDFVELSSPAVATPVQIKRTAASPGRRLTEFRSISGRLVNVDFLKGVGLLEVQSHQSRGSRIVKLTFSDEFADEMQAHARQIVLCHGDAGMAPSGDIAELSIVAIELIRDDRASMWAAKRFRMPTPEEAIDDPDIEEFVRTTYEARRDDL